MPKTYPKLGHGFRQIEGAVISAASRASSERNLRRELHHRPQERLQVGQVLAAGAGHCGQVSLL